MHYPGSASADAVHDLAIDHEGRIVVAGTTTFEPDATSRPVFGLARYLADGSLDSSFGSEGLSRPVFGTDSAWARGVAVQPDGAVIAAGWLGYQADFALARLNSDGALDTSFGGDGSIATDLGGNDSAADLIAQASGRVTAIGSTEGKGGGDFALVRHKPTGALQYTFSQDGKLNLDFDDSDDSGDGVVLKNGKVVVSGTVGDRIGVARFKLTYGPADFDADGVLDGRDECPHVYGQDPDGCPR